MSETVGRLWMRLSDGSEQQFEIAREQISLGRATINDIVIPEPNVSRSHARLEIIQGNPVIFDLDSANGVRVNGQPVREARLNQGDVFTLGGAEFRFEPGRPSPAGEITLIDSETDLEATLASETIAMAVNETAYPRLALTFEDKTEEFVLFDDSVTIGRHSSNQVVLSHERVSRQHAAIEQRSGGVFLRDLNSTNGTWVGGERITERELRDGDTIKIGSANLVFKSGFREESLTFNSNFTFHQPIMRKPVIFVPGIMGSQLWRGSELVWPNVRALFREPDVFRFTEDSKLEPRGIVNEVVIVPNLIKSEQYGRMGQYLVEELGYERDVDFIEFAYDWRRDVRDSARRLGELVETWGANRPVTIIAHSLGTLVSRYYVERLGGKARVEQLVLMGGPHTGTPKAVTSLVHGPDILPFGIMGQHFGEVMATFVTSYQILPTYACITDQHGKKFSPFDDDRWLPEHRRPLLRNAREFRKELGMGFSVPTISVFGYGLETVRKLSVERSPDGAWTRLDFDLANEGDTSVPQSSAVLPGTDLHPIRQYHGSLFVDNDVKMRLKLLLTGG